MGAIIWGKKRNTAGEVMVKFVKGLDAEDYKETVMTEHLETMMNASNEEFLTFIKLAKEHAVIFGGESNNEAGEGGESPANKS